MKELKFRLLNNGVTQFLVFCILKVYFATLSIRVECDRKIDEAIRKGERVVIACWHQRFFAGVVAPRIFGRTLYNMSSRSRDGDFVVPIIRRFGWHPVRGSSSSGGSQALKELIRFVERGNSAVMVVDGPTGPPRVVKPGVVRLAQVTGGVIVPVYVLYENAWIFNSWDRFMVPKPFSRVRIIFGESLPVPAVLSNEEFEAVRFLVERTMIEHYESFEGSPE